MQRISVIAPVYNERENIGRFIDRVERALQKEFESYEIVLIDDGSNDGSRELLQQLSQNNVHIKNLHFTCNNGQTAALDAGFKHATGEIIVMMDSDLQTDPEDIYLLLPYLKDYDVVNGRRATREDGLLRKFSSWVGNQTRNWITEDTIQDTGCPLKLFKKEVIKSFILYEGFHRFLPTLAKLNGYSVIEVPVRHFDREYGTSKYGVFNRLGKGLKDALAIRWMKTRKLHYQILPAPEEEGL